MELLDWMTSNGVFLLMVLLFYLIVVPLGVLLHEVGHGVGIIAVSKYHARIYLGKWDIQNKENFSIGRLHFCIRWSYVGCCAWRGCLGRRQNIIVSAGGPIASLLLALLCGGLIMLVQQGEWRSFLLGVAIFNFIQFFVTVIPVTYPHWMGPYGGIPSDGLQIVRLLRQTEIEKM